MLAVHLSLPVSGLRLNGLVVLVLYSFVFETMQVQAAAAFAHWPKARQNKPRYNRIQARAQQHEAFSKLVLSSSSDSSPLEGEEIVRRLQEQLSKLRERDRKSRTLEQKDLKVIFEDKHIIVVDKPSGVLSVPSGIDIPSLAQTVFERCRYSDDKYTEGEKINTMDQMVVHRLGLDTSGLIVFAKSMDGLRGMNTLFRTRKVTRQYEALVCGHIPSGKDTGWVSLPLMRDYVSPPFMRVSTDKHQQFLTTLDPLVVGKRIMEAPKASLTRYDVIAREELDSSNNGSILPVTRITLTAFTGRTHQLNVHMAAIGHPIVGDRIYGFGGDAVPNGGLSDAELNVKNPDRASSELQERIAGSVTASNVNMCVHAKALAFYHPITDENMTFDSTPLF